MALIDELESHLASRYPAESRHGCSVEKLIREGVAFFVARIGGAPVGCVGVQLYGRDYGELKRMYVRPAFRARSVTVLRLETGIHQAEALGLYESFGFERCGPFGAYRDDPLSLYFEKRI